MRSGERRAAAEDKTVRRCIDRRDHRYGSNDVTDRYRTCDAALRDLGLSCIHRRGKRPNNRMRGDTLLDTSGFRSLMDSAVDLTGRKGARESSAPETASPGPA
jgi:hypothetical protein